MEIFKKNETINGDSYFFHPFNISEEDIKEWKKEYKIPDKAIDISKFEKPNESNLHIEYITDYLRSSSINAILPIFNNIEVLFRKSIGSKYGEKHNENNDNYLYIETKSGCFNKNNTKYFIRILREIWSLFPNLKIQFSHFCIKNNNPFSFKSDIFLNEEKTTGGDFVDWSQIPIVKSEKSFSLDGEDRSYFEYLILKPF